MSSLQISDLFILKSYSLILKVVAEVGREGGKKKRSSFAGFTCPDDHKGRGLAWLKSGAPRGLPHG